MATKKSNTKKAETIYLAKWNRRIGTRIEETTVKCVKKGNKYVALDGTEIPEWAEIILPS